MLFKNIVSAATLLLPLVSASIAPKFHTDSKWKRAKSAYFPKNATDVKSITTPSGVTIRYKEPGTEGICETTPGVGSYSGFIDLAPNVHFFFWFFESRQDPANDPLSIWLNGGPGSDSLIGLFQELGPCRITPELDSVINPYSWNNVSNMLFLSQPVGTGFSYQEIANGTVDNWLGTFLNKSAAAPGETMGTWPILDPVDVGTVDTTDLAAQAAWHVLQGFLSGLPQLDASVDTKKDFNLWTESYGGHYGPAFFNHFYKQNEKIEAGTLQGYPLNFVSLGIGNGIIDESIQAPWYPEFAVNNTYGIKAYNDTVYSYAKFAAYMPNGCLDQIASCIEGAQAFKGGYSAANGILPKAFRSPSEDSLCQEAADMCRDNVESPYYYFSGRGVYDIRHPYNDPTPPTYFEAYLNQAYVQNALGVSTNYTDANSDIYWQFQHTGDFIYPNFLDDLQQILNSGVRVSLYYGDADYICNWFGGQAVSEQVKYKHAKQFRKAGYAPLMYGGVEYGEVREYGNFSFARVYESGHEVPYYQPEGSLAIFNRTISLVDIATGEKAVTGTRESSGPLNATHTAPPVPLFTGTGAAYSSYSSSLISSYGSKDNDPVPTMKPRAYNA